MCSKFLLASYPAYSATATRLRLFSSLFDSWNWGSTSILDDSHHFEAKLKCLTFSGDFLKYIKLDEKIVILI